MKYRVPSQILAKIMYYCVTTLSDIQTIGEEYTGIIQVDSSGRQLPSKSVRTNFWLTWLCRSNSILIKNLLSRSVLAQGFQ